MCAGQSWTDNHEIPTMKRSSPDSSKNLKEGIRVRGLRKIPLANRKSKKALILYLAHFGEITQFNFLGPDTGKTQKLAWVWAKNLPSHALIEPLSPFQSRKVTWWQSEKVLRNQSMKQNPKNGNEPFHRAGKLLVSCMRAIRRQTDLRYEMRDIDGSHKCHVSNVLAGQRRGEEKGLECEGLTKWPHLYMGMRTLLTAWKDHWSAGLCNEFRLLLLMGHTTVALWGLNSWTFRLRNPLSSYRRWNGCIYERLNFSTMGDHCLASHTNE